MPAAWGGKQGAYLRVARHAVRRGFTLAELLVVIAIMGILALCITKAAKGAFDRADVVRCMGNMRGIHVALGSAIIEEGLWPQCPLTPGEEGYDQWWVKHMSRYQVSENNWICASLARQTHAETKETAGDKMKIHYIPTPFDENPFTPRRWSKMPWLVEVADMHGEGNLIAFPDGSIIGAARFFSNNP